MKNFIKYFLSVLACGIFLALVACSGAQERKVNYFEKAKVYYKEKNYDKASVELRNAIQIDPKYLDALFLFGQVQEKRGDLRAAFQTFYSIVDENPDYSPARAALARLYVLAGVSEKAAEVVDFGLKTDPNNPALLTVRAALDAQAGKLKLAIEKAQSSYKLVPSDEITIALLASLYKQNNQLDKAVAVVEDGIKLLPQSADLVAVLIDLETSLNNLDSVQELMEKIIQLEPNNLSYRIQLAKFYIFRKDLPAAEAVLRKTIKDLPDIQDAKLALVDFLWSQLSESDAAKEISILLANNPKDGQLKLSLAEFLGRQGKGDQAEQYLNEIIKTYDNEAAGLSARNRLAAIYLAKYNNPVKAMALVEEVIKINPKDNDALIIRANLLLKQGDAAAAITDLRGVLRDQPNSAPLMRALAKAHIQNNELSLAEETLRSALQANPGDNLTRKELAQLLVQQGRADQAKILLEQLAKVDGSVGDMDVIDAQFRVQVLSKDYAAAQLTAEKRKQLRPKESLGWYFAGLVAEGKNDRTAARKEFEIALQKQPDGAEPLVALVRMDLQDRQNDKALQRIERVLALNPNHGVALNLKGELLLVEKKWLAAEASFRKSAESAPDWWAPYRGLAQTMLAQQKVADAIGAYRDGINKAKKDVGILFTELASLYEQMNKVDESVKVYQQWLQREPKSQLAANNLAMLYLNYYNDKASIDRAVKLADIFAASTDPALIDTRGWIKYKAGDYSGALPLLQQASKASPQNRVMKYHLGMAQLKLNNVAEAKANLQASLKDNQPFAGMDEAAKALASMAKK